MRFLAIIGGLFLVLGLTTPPAYAAAGHGCASPIPPAVPGTLINPPAQHGILFLNEILLAPHSTWNCTEQNTYSPVNDAWVELYNPQNQPFNLYAVHAALDSGPGTNAFYLPLGAAIAAHGFLTLFPRSNQLFTATETSTLRLSIAGSVIDEVSLPALPEEQSYARIPDGGSTWQITTTPSISAKNVLTTASSPSSTTASQASSSNDSANTSARQVDPSGAQSGKAISNGKTQAGLLDGKQPGWDHIATPAPPTMLASAPTASVIPSSTSSNALDLLHKLLLTLLTLALAGALFWCSKLFRLT
ncbi:hypothetical protein EPA93_20405 [Ktedonosporobacter rubrisoli]|uniref:Lamin tail domain-containing protein n=1 Tax=Ktedonosporobacter rubrisoli TaxID=2509675 RepID=A0A4P6JS77_KTERU|nr:hypothetical protein [Ktedonosporobacter rubrisoli]QBD78234.1 hypothetical protein EPA93_20405 [Ktedonosporobacter rubrisoli]